MEKKCLIKEWMIRQVKVLETNNKINELQKKKVKIESQFKRSNNQTIRIPEKQNRMTRRKTSFKKIAQQ